jgi:hypothetical protein
MRLIFALALIVSLSSAAWAQDAATFSDVLELPPTPRPEVSPRTSDRSGAFALRAGPYRPRQIDPLGEVAWEDVFGRSAGAMIMFDWEWQPIRLRWVGQLGAGASAGFFRRRGLSLRPDGTASAERETFLIVPASLDLTYRAKLLGDNQFFVPYGGVGLDAWYFSDNTPAGASTSGLKYGWHWRAGAQLLLDVFDPGGAGAMDVNWGINNTYLFAEFRKTDMTGFGRGVGFDLSANTWFFGLLLEY